MKKLQGDLIRGTYRGTRVNRSRPDMNGEVKETLYCGVSYIKQGRYGPEEVTKEMIISKALITEGVPTKLQALEGKEVEFPVFYTPWSNGKGMSCFLANNVKDVLDQPVRAAS